MQAALKPLRLVTNQPPSELETLFQAHHGRVFRTAQRITGSAADAEDVLQTVFLRLDQGPGRLRLVTKSRGLSFPRGHKRFARSVAESHAVESPSLSTTSTSIRLPAVSGVLKPFMPIASCRHWFARLLRDLGKTAGEMFVLRYYEGFDNKEIAALMKTSPLVVGVVLHRARTKLRKEIGHYLEKHHEKE